MLVSTVTAITFARSPPAAAASTPLARRGHHGAGTQAVDGEQVGAGARRGLGGAAHLVRDIVELEVQKHLEPALAELVDDGRPLGIEERHAHLQPCRMAGERIGKLEGALAPAVERDNHAVARIGL